MFKHLTRYSAQDILIRWEENGLATPEQIPAIQKFTHATAGEEELPLYLRALAGVGAFFSSLCFVAFLAVSKLIDFKSESELLIWGIFFILGAIILAHVRADDDRAVRHSFFMQTSFCLIALGKTLFIIGVTLLFKEERGWAVTGATFCISLLTYHVYRMSLDRFCTALVVFVSCYINLLGERLSVLGLEVLLILFLLVQVLLAGFLFTQSSVRRAYFPLAYAAVASLCLVTLHISATQFAHVPLTSPAVVEGSLTVLLTLSLIALLGWTAGGVREMKKEPLLVALAGIILLGCLSVPGILLAIICLTLGYSKHERPLMVIGALLFPAFIILFYYNLQASFLVKSGILITSGVLLLFGRLYLAIRNLDGREAP